MRRPFHRRSRHHIPSGHTLWEMLFALALLGVISAIVAPSIGVVRAQTHESDVEQTARDLTGALAEARLLALERGTPIDFVLDPATGRVWIVSRTLDDQRVSATGQVRLSPGVTLLGDAPRVRFSFDAAGTASGGAVIVRGVGGERRVTVDPWTGAPDVQTR